MRNNMNGCPIHGTEFLKTTRESKKLRGNSSKYTYCAAVISTSIYGGKPMQELCMWHPEKDKPVKQTGEYRCSVCGELTGKHYNLCTEHNRLYAYWHSLVRAKRMTLEELRTKWKELKQGFKTAA
jgi:hypothetical protein